MNVSEWLGKENTLGIDIWEKKYRYNNESLDEWFDRVSGGNKEVEELIRQKKFLFGGRTLSNRGTGKKGSYSNCYSRGFIEDDYNDILEANKQIGLTFKAQGGQGLSLTKLRPKGCGINNGQFVSDGIIPFMKIYNQTTESTSQGGSRKGALLMSLDIWHKEADRFITIKSQENEIQKANLSLEIDDEFMECVRQYYATGEKIEKHISRDYNGNKIEYDVVPIDLYKLMMQNAYDWAEPGCLFINRFRNFNIMEFHSEYKIENCNPCGEQSLCKNGACNLGSLNLSEFVKNPFTSSAYFDTDEFVYAVRVAIEGLDEVVTEGIYLHPLKEQREVAYNYRNTGLGIMGMWDMLVKLGITYGSQESKDFMDSLMSLMFKTAVIESSHLASAKGKFPKYEDSVWNSNIIKQHFTETEIEILELRNQGLRNCSLLSVAPTGSLGTMLDISTGCEPSFQISYVRKTESLNNGEDKYYEIFIGLAKEYMNKYKTEVLPEYFVSSSDIDWRDRIDMQAILQNHVDTAISSTVNLPNKTTLSDIERLYLYAWEKGLKGVTIYRDGCKRSGILSTAKVEEEKREDASIAVIPRGMLIKVDDNGVGKERHLTTGCGTLHCVALFDPVSGDLLETYLSKGSTGGCLSNLAAISRMLSTGARSGIDVYTLVDQLESCPTCPSYAVRNATKHDTSKGNCCPSAIGHALIDMYEEMQIDLFEEDDSSKMPKKAIKKIEIQESKTLPQKNSPKCPECGSQLIFEGGCNTCKNCGYSKCD